MNRQWWKASYPPRFVAEREHAKVYPTRLFAEITANDLKRAAGPRAGAHGLDVEPCEVVPAPHGGWQIMRFEQLK